MVEKFDALTRPSEQPPLPLILLKHHVCCLFEPRDCLPGTLFGELLRLAQCNPTSSADLTCRAPVPLSAAVFRPVLQLQLPGVCSPQDKRLIPRAPECVRGTRDTRIDAGGFAKLALDEG